MHSLPLLLSLSILSPAALAASPKETLAQFNSALAAGRAEAASTLLSPGIQVYESGFVEHTRDEYIGHHLAADIEFAKATNKKVLAQSERVSGKLAVVMQETETTGTFKGKPVHLLGTETAVLEQQGENWLIVHVHWSSRKAK